MCEYAKMYRKLFEVKTFAKIFIFVSTKQFATSAFCFTKIIFKVTSFLWDTGALDLRSLSLLLMVADLRTKMRFPHTFHPPFLGMNFNGAGSFDASVRFFL